MKVVNIVFSSLVAFGLAAAPFHAANAASTATELKKPVPPKPEPKKPLVPTPVKPPPAKKP